MEKLIRKSVLNVLLIGLLVSQATVSFSQSSQGNRNAVPGCQWDLDRNAVPWLPFDEDWSTAYFETNHWVVEEYDSWQIAGQSGNDAPSAEFNYYPALQCYSKTLTSRLLSAKDMIDGSIYLSFDIKHTLVNATSLEYLRIQVFSDSMWTTVMSDSNRVSYDWITKKLDLTEYVKGEVFKIRFLAEGENNLDIVNWMIDNISVYRECAIPLNFWAGLNFPSISEIMMEWDPPAVGSGNWLGWNNGINNDAIGLTDGGSFSAAIRFTPVQLQGYIGASLTKLRFFPSAEGNFVVKVWTGNNAGNLVLEQPLTTISAGEWNEVILTAPVPVTGDIELWIGYAVTHEDGDNPAGVDAGPAIMGFGDMISQDGSTWESMATAYALNYNWNIEGFVEGFDKHHNGTNTCKLAYSTREPEHQEQIADVAGFRNRSLLYYNVFKNAELLDTTSATTYIDTMYVFMEDACYSVQAVYADCMSDLTEEVCVLIVAQQQSQPMVCYPVPADHILTIESETELSSLIITNFNYQPVFQTYNPGPGTITINTSAFRNGLYMIRAIDSSGKSHSSKFIVNH